MLEERYESDKDLLAGLAAGEREAVSVLLDLHAPIVYGFVYARVGGDDEAAQDLLQETLLEAVRSARTFRGEAALSTWLCAIARRRLARHYERERRAEVARIGLAALPASAHQRASGEDDARTLEQRDEVVRALGALPALHRQVLVMKYMDGSSVEQIAADLGRSRVQVQSLLQRARLGLRRVLEASDAAEDA